MKYLVVGSGGREHVLSWRLLHDGSADEVYVAPGNGGIEKKYRVPVEVSDFEGIYSACLEKDIDVVVVGPEVPLVEGITDYLSERNVKVFGPSAKAAMLEGSKIFAKGIMKKYGVPTGQYHEIKGKQALIEHVKGIETFPVVIKLDGLAAGKGVGIPESREEAFEFIESMVKEDTRVFVEEFLDGEEASVLGICDGETVLPCVAAQDHKRIYEGDTGPNTGGMGAYAPAPVMTAARLERVQKEVLIPTVEGMKAEGIPFKGILYAGLIIKGDDIKVLEFNVRFGDPEAQVVLPLLKGKLGDYLQASINGTLSGMKLEFMDKHAITVVMSSGGYPGSYEKGKVIWGLEKVPNDLMVFHAGTRADGTNIVTSGGRVLNVTAMADSLKKAADMVYNNIDTISFEGAYYRSDIGHRALK